MERSVLYLLTTCLLALTVSRPVIAQAPTGSLTERGGIPRNGNMVPRTEGENGTVAGSTTPGSTTPGSNSTGTSTNGETQSAIVAVQANIEELTSNTSIDATLKERLLTRYRSTLELLRTYALNTETMAKFASAASLAIDKVATAREQLKQLPTPFAPPNNGEQLSLEELKQKRAESDAELAAARQALETLEAKQRDRETRRMLLPKLIADARAAIDQADAAPAPEVEDDPEGLLKAAVDAERTARLRVLRQSLDMLVQEQLMIEAEGDLIPLQVDLAKREADLASQQFQYWSDKLGMQKQYQVERDLDDHSEHLSKLGFASEQSLVLRSRQDWLDLLREQSRLESKKTRVQARYSELSETYKSVQNEVERDITGGRGLRSGLGLKLQLVRNRLPSNAELTEEMSEIDVLIDQTQTQQSRLEIAIEDTRQDNGQALPLHPNNQLPLTNGVINTEEVRLIRQMKKDVDQQLNLLIELKNDLELKRKLVSDIEVFIESHVIWIRNAPPFHWSDFSTAWWSFRRIVHPISLKAVVFAIRDGMLARYDLIFIWIVTALSLWCVGSRLRRRLTAVDRDSDQPSTHENDQSLRPTVVALVITILLAFPPVVTLAVLAYAIRDAADQDMYLLSVASALLMAALALFPVEALRQMLRPGGLAVAHFGYRNETVLPPRTSLRVLIDIGLPLLIIWGIANESTRLLGDASLARLIFAFAMIALAYLLWHSLNPQKGLLSDFIKENPDSWTNRLSNFWHPLISLVPSVLAVLAMLGYVYTATLLAGRLYWTLWLGIGVLVIGGLLRQWFITYRRRVALNRLPTPTVETTQVDGSPIEVSAEPSLDVKEMDAQSLRLIQAMLWIAGFVGIVLIWSPVFPAIHFLDAVALWSTTAADGSIVPVTLANVVVAIPIIILSFVAVKNVPGLLESVLLERLPIDRPARYAVTTLASYALAIIGIVLSAKTFGLRWESIQWLVAALGVGLGFGLQEIFANFVSGLILLFEQPIRVGDVVTIDGVTGTVSQIRMRATVVKNADLQELIIPNKDLITGRIVNWTLSDSTNRLTLNVGVAYGTDTRKACQIIEQICAQHENLLVDPAPVVTFEGFGDSTLNIVIRCFLGILDNRLATIHELNTTINDRFKTEGIEIAFPQRDLHIRSLPESIRLGTQSTTADSDPLSKDSNSQNTKNHPGTM